MAICFAQPCIPAIYVRTVVQNVAFIYNVAVYVLCQPAKQTLSFLVCELS